MNGKQQEEKLEDWLSRHRGLLIKVVRSFARSIHDQNDLAQEIAVQIWRSIPGYTETVAESTWLYRVALYTAINWNRRERKRREQPMSDETLMVLIKPSADEGIDPRLDWLYERISGLKPIDRSIALMLLDGLSYREMSEAIGITESHVGVRINRIKKKLVEQLSEEKSYELR